MYTKDMYIFMTVKNNMYTKDTRKYASFFQKIQVKTYTYDNITDSKYFMNTLGFLKESIKTLTNIFKK